MLPTPNEWGDPSMRAEVSLRLFSGECFQLNPHAVEAFSRVVLIFRTEVAPIILARATMDSLQPCLLALISSPTVIFVDRPAISYPFHE